MKNIITLLALLAVVLTSCGEVQTPQQKKEQIIQSIIKSDCIIYKTDNMIIDCVSTLWGGESKEYYRIADLRQRTLRCSRVNAYILDLDESFTFVDMYSGKTITVRKY